MTLKNCRLLALAVGFLLGVTLLGPETGTFETSHAQTGGAPVKIMPLGDSITEGSPAGGYRAVLYDLLTRDHINFVFVGSEKLGKFPNPEHEGHGSFATIGIRIGLRTRDWLESATPDLILLHIGTVDIRVGVDGPTVSTRLSRLLDDIMSRLPNAHIIVAQILPLGDPKLEAVVKQYNAAIPGIASAKGSRMSVVNMHDSFSAADHLYDGIHPNDRGNEKMARVWEPAILTVLNEHSGSTIPQQ
jgi:lysophospholipase L1-like esterase